MKSQSDAATAQKIYATAHYIPKISKNLITPHSFLVWTADNVVRFDLIKSMTLKLYAKGGFESFSVRSHVNSKMWDAVSEVESWTIEKSLKDTLKSEIVDALYPQPLSLILKDYPEYQQVSCTFNEESNGSFCLDLTKLKVYEFFIDSNEGKSKTIEDLAKIQNSIFEQRHSKLNEYPIEIKSKIQDVQQSIAYMEELSSLISLSKLVMQINTCSPQINWCTQTIVPKIKQLLLQKLFPAGRNLFSEASMIVDYSGKLKKDLLSKYLSILQLQTAIVKWVIENNKTNKLYLHTVLNNKYMGIPIPNLEKFGWSLSKQDKSLSSFFKIFPVHTSPTILNSRFDIGSLLSIEGIFPIGTVSSLSNQESGGAVLRPLPQPNSDITKGGSSLDAASDMPLGDNGC